MCGRFRQTRAAKILEQQFNAGLLDALNDFDILPRVNIAPAQPVVVVKQAKGKPRTITMMRWGLIPAWAKDQSIGNKTINARSESVETTASFSDSARSRRCLIPADGFYEWKKTGKVRQPYCFQVGEGELFAFAGLWDTWKNPQGETIESCTILTTDANDLVSNVHGRMPVIVPPEKYELWLNPDMEDFEAVKGILKPYDPTTMHSYPAGDGSDKIGKFSLNLWGFCRFVSQICSKRFQFRVPFSGEYRVRRKCVRLSFRENPFRRIPCARAVELAKHIDDQNI
jgi:putative SOS response-associated peptidase YedK